ncbi:hypothetical protein M7I_1676 [Glarea lozoyensis 74030]|nr:hypothetical protein M7I_1676 [Glarea lozoyensis 74030]
MADTQDISRSQEVTSLDIIQQKDDVTTCTREIALSTETTGQGDHINSIPTTEAKDLPVTDSQLTQIREKLAELEAVITTLKAASVSTVKSPEHDPEAEEAAELAKRWEKEAEEVRRLEEENIASAIRIKDFDTPKGVSHVASEQWLLKDFRTTWTSSDTKSVLIISMKKFRGATTHVESTTLHDQRPHDDITGVIVQAVQAQNLSEPDILYQEKMSGAEPPARQADRLAFGNAEVLLEIGKKCGLNIPIGSKVLLRPFKPLVYYEEYFRELLRTQESLHDTLTLRFEENLASVPEHKPDNTGENPSGQVVTMTDEIRDGTPNLEKETERDEVLWKLKRDVVAARKLRNGLRCLIYFMDVYMQDILEMHGKIQRGEVKEIAFDYLWMLFKRGEEIVTTKSQIQAYHVLQVTGGRSIVPALSDDTEKKRARISQTRTSALVIDCFYLDFDGKKFGPVMKTFTIEPFEGSMPLSALECIPLPKDGIKRESLIDRGKKFVKATKTAHMNYRGLTVKQNVTSKVEEV